MIHTNADPEVVPLEVTIGVPDPKPKVLPELAVAPASWKDTIPELLTVRWNALSEPPFSAKETVPAVG
jgi:hypothetical protein